MKRKASHVPSLLTKQQHIECSSTQVPMEAVITDTKSLREQAKPYRLCIAKLLLEALMPS